MQRRKLLGYLIPAFNVPLFLYNLYQTYLHFQDGMVVGSSVFWEDFIVLASTLFLTIVICAVMFRLLMKTFGEV